MNQQYDQCTKDLVEQPSPSSPSSTAWRQYDEKLQTFVQIQQKYWSLRMQSHLNRYRSLVEEQNLYHDLLSHSSNDDEVSFSSFRIEITVSVCRLLSERTNQRIIEM